MFGGTVDLYCKLDGVPTLIDFKTSKGIFDEMLYQVGAYRQLLMEHNYPVKNTRILRIGRTEDEGFEERHLPNPEVYWQIFEHALRIYQLRKKVK